LSSQKRVCYGLFPGASPLGLKGFYAAWGRVGSEWSHGFTYCSLGDDAKRCNTRRKSEQSRVSECTWRVRLVVLGVPYWLLLLTGGALLGGSMGVTLPRRDRFFASFSLLVGLVSWIAVCDLKK
jgi:hypothetical protein